MIELFRQSNAKKIIEEYFSIPEFKELLKQIRYTLEMQFFSNRDNMYAVARSLGLGSEIYFDAETGWLSPAGGQWSYIYLVPDKQVDIAESLGWDPSAARVLEFKWERDGKEIFVSSNTVRRDNVRVYPYSDEAYDYCKIIVTNNDDTNEQAMHIWGYCHFINAEFYDLLKRRMTETYPMLLLPELDKIKRRLKK